MGRAGNFKEDATNRNVHVLEGIDISSVELNNQKDN